MSYEPNSRFRIQFFHPMPSASAQCPMYLKRKCKTIIKLLYYIFLDDETYVTCMFDGDFLSTQCVAVRTHSGLINEPPQNCRPSRVRSNACQGQELMGATVPPTINVELEGRIPQTAERGMK